MVILIVKFQSYQFRQINPDKDCPEKYVKYVKRFQSYQFRQINPDVFIRCKLNICIHKVSIVSIHADQSRPEFYRSIGIRF